jgi:hypothetical protein
MHDDAKFFESLTWKDLIDRYHGAHDELQVALVAGTPESRLLAGAVGALATVYPGVRLALTEPVRLQTAPTKAESLMILAACQRVRAALECQAMTGPAAHT